MSEVKTLVTLVLGGMFDHRELGDIDIVYEAQACEALQLELVDSTDDVHVELVSRIDFDAAQSELAALREDLEMARDDLVIFKGAISALGEAAKKLVVCARTTGGTAGPDKGLMDACSGVESVITIGGIARAMNEFEKLTAERDDLAARLEQVRDRKNSIVDLQQRLTAAEQRNAALAELLSKGFNCMESSGGKYRITMDFRTGDECFEAYSAICNLCHCDSLVREPKPTESGASE